MSIEITGPCKVRLRNGFEGEVRIERSSGDPRPVVAGDSRWHTNGSRFGGTDYFDIVEVLEIIEPPKPVVIDGSGEYWCRDCVIATVSHHDPDRETGPGSAPWVGVRADGIRTSWCQLGHFAVHDHNYDIVAKVAYRTHPLTPDEAFKLLDTWVWPKDGSGGRQITHVGLGSVRLFDSCLQTDKLVSLEVLARDYAKADGKPLSVTEPIPFAG